MSNLTNSIIQDLRSREERGYNKYGTTMDRKDLSHVEWLNHAYEEALDMAQYLKKSKHMDINEVCIEAVNHFGTNSQVMKAIEEFSELTKELAKDLNGIGNESSTQEEIADCWIMLTQLMYMYNVHNNIEQIIETKLTRLKQLINDTPQND